jgi:hypothetical protein
MHFIFWFTWFGLVNPIFQSFDISVCAPVSSVLDDAGDVGFNFTDQ